MTSITTLQKAIDLVTKAVEEDCNENYEEALRLYEDSIECFLFAIQHEVKGEKAKESIRVKCRLYLERAEKIKDAIKKINDKPIEDGDINNKQEKTDNNNDDPEKKNPQPKFEGASDMNDSPSEPM